MAIRDRWGRSASDPQYGEANPPIYREPPQMPPYRGMLPNEIERKYVDPEALDLDTAAQGMVYGSTKTYDHSVGLSCAFRQWRAESHCKFIHGYAIKVHFEFETENLDHRHWAVDFGSLKSLKGWLEDMFDHKTLVAADDPKISIFRELEIAGMIQMRVVPATGCEAMSRMIYEFAETWLKDNGYVSVILKRVTVAEHTGNSAYYGKA